MISAALGQTGTTQIKNVNEILRGRLKSRSQIAAQRHLSATRENKYFVNKTKQTEYIWRRASVLYKCKFLIGSL